MSETTERCESLELAAIEAAQRAARKYLEMWTSKPSAEAIRVAVLLELWQGMHHLDNEAMRKVDWTRFYVAVKFSVGMAPGGMATYDFNDLTTLVFLAHDLCIRVQFGDVGRGYYTLLFHPRDGREGSTPKRHPTLERAVLDWRAHHPFASV